MGTLASELSGHAERVSGRPRVYVDANVSARLVSFMRRALRWDVLFVVEHDDLRRARDDEHYRLARQLGRTLITQDRDYLDDRRFPPQQSGGVLVLAAPAERGFIALLKRVDRDVLRPPTPSDSVDHQTPVEASPLEGRKMHMHVDWSGGRTAS